ncbi:hypothetical protein [Haloferula sp.]|uniref:hypothetical protein n=1 Tax=Haloferula sp. TaxID=2497595 RepID=UPI00329BB4FA
MILITGYILGNFIAAAICYQQPKLYESTGIFTEWAAPERKTQVATAHAAIVVAQLELHRRWELTFEDAVQKIIEGISIESTASSTIIRGRFSSAHDSRQIVDELMDQFPGIEREHQWAQIKGLDGHYSKKEIKNLRVVDKLRSVIFDSLKESESDIPGNLISQEAVERLGNKDLLRQFDAYQKTVKPLGRFSPPDGKILVPPPIAAKPFEAEDPISPNVDTYFLVGRVSGLIAAMLALSIIWHRRPNLIEIPPAKPEPSPAWAEVKSTAAVDDPTW